MSNFVHHPFWGSPTGEDHCEGSYLVTPLLAEFWGSMNSMLFIGVAVFGYLKAVDCQGKRSDFRFPALFIGMGVSALFSFWAHATLQYSLERFDEAVFNAEILLLVYLSFEDLVVLMFFQIHVLFSSLLTLAYPFLFHFHLVPITMALAYRIYRLLKDTELLADHGMAIMMTSLNVMCWIGCLIFWTIEKMHCHPMQFWWIPSYHSICQFCGFCSIYLSITTVMLCHAHTPDYDNEVEDGCKMVSFPLPFMKKDQNFKRPLTTRETIVKNRRTLAEGDVSLRKRHIDIRPE